MALHGATETHAATHGATRCTQRHTATTTHTPIQGATKTHAAAHGASRQLQLTWHYTPLLKHTQPRIMLHGNYNSHGTTRRF